MTTKTTVIYDNPQDPAAFEAGYPDKLALAKKFPGIQKVEGWKVWPKEDGSPIPLYPCWICTSPTTTPPAGR